MPLAAAAPAKSSLGLDLATPLKKKIRFGVWLVVAVARTWPPTKEEVDGCFVLFFFYQIWIILVIRRPSL